MPLHKSVKLTDKELREQLLSTNIEILAALKLNSDKQDLLRQMDLKINAVVKKLDAQNGTFANMEKIVSDHDYIIHGKEGSPYNGLVPVFQCLENRYLKFEDTVINFIDKHQLMTVQEAGEVAGIKKGKTQAEKDADRALKWRTTLLTLAVTLAVGWTPIIIFLLTGVLKLS